MDWKFVYNEMREKGYHLELPSDEEMQGFRDNIERQHDLNPENSNVNVFYILGYQDNNLEGYFGSEELIQQTNEDIKSLSLKVKEANPSFQYCGYQFGSTPLELVSRRLNAGQGNIELINPYQDHKGVYVTWRDSSDK